MNIYGYILSYIVLFLWGFWLGVRVKQELYFRKPRKERYSFYLRSKKWKAFRKTVLERDGFNCVMCGTAYNLEVHHVTYRNVGWEKLEDCVTLCDTCHTKVHSKKLKNTRNEKKVATV